MSTGAGKDASLLHVMRTVLFGALGVRRRLDHDEETARIKPAHVIVAGLIGAALFVLTLITVARLVVSG